MRDFRPGYYVGLLRAGLFIVLIAQTMGAKADLLDTLEKTLMPGPLSSAHEKYINECHRCHSKFKKDAQDELCTTCHDHNNIAQDIKSGQGFHGREPRVRAKACKTCHKEHSGRDVSLILLDTLTFDHRFTDFPLRNGHTSVRCAQCHAQGKPYREAKRTCHACHEKIEPHKGRLGKQCDSCHQGSNWLDFVFDHGKTKFALEGKHNGVVCRNCHPLENYRNITRQCSGCHLTDDKHETRYGAKCEKCHSPAAWHRLGFDHNRDTKYALKDAHRVVGCDQCHQDNPYETTTTRKCFDCHEKRDTHKGDFGKKCEDCHSQKQWNKNTFSHDDTDYPLTGKHSRVRCKACHITSIYDELESRCVDCHKHHDIHNEKQGQRCESCHVTSGWSSQVSFDHDLTAFPLLGAHEGLGCESCHASGDFKQAKVQCKACHGKDDRHKRRFGAKCELCHLVLDWKSWDFNHDKQTRFKLRGAHRNTDCLACHREVTGDDVKMPRHCSECHQEQDVHDGAFGRLCQRCHNETDFRELMLQ